MAKIKDLSAEEKKQLIKALEKRKEEQRFNRIDSFFPDEGPLRRELYPKHLEFFKAGSKHKERAFIAANRCGKTIAGCYELALHALGRYPDWWEGKRFNKPVNIWCIGVSAEQVKKVLQFELIGPKHALGTGMIPKDNIERTTHASLPPDTIKEAYIKSEAGGLSYISFLNCGQGRKFFQGSAIDIALIDEECPMDIYSEILLRTMTTKGIILLTFTPLQGLSDLVLSYLPGGNFPVGGVVHE